MDGPFRPLLDGEEKTGAGFRREENWGLPIDPGKDFLDGVGKGGSGEPRTAELVHSARRFRPKGDPRGGCRRGRTPSCPEEDQREDKTDPPWDACASRKTDRCWFFVIVSVAVKAIMIQTWIQRVSKNSSGSRSGLH